MKLSRFLVTLTLALTTSLLAVDSAPKRSPNVIIVLIDDMGLTDLSCYGSKFYESPNNDQ